MLHLVLSFSLFHVICGSLQVLQNSSSFSQSNLDVLCDLGCKCPDETQTLDFLDCSLLEIKTLPDFLQLPSYITKLSFQGNHITSIPMSTFIKVDLVEELDLSQNNVQDIENFAFTSFKSLAELKVSNNKLPEVGPRLLEGLENLLVLELSHNKIQRISAASFKTTQNVQDLRLQYNPIFELPENLFQYLPRLQKLDLQETGLVKLPCQLFTPTPLLHWISLSDNAFEKVPQAALSQAPSLEKLDLSGNDFKLLDAGAFKGLINVTSLYLNNLQRLSRIEKNALAGLEKLKTFSCSYNPKLNFIHGDVFGAETSSTTPTKKTPPREQLHLRQNALRTLQPPLQKEALSALSFVDLTENPWHCDCNLEWMAFLRKEHQMNIRCDSPPHLQGRSFNTIGLSELRCDNKWNTIVLVSVISTMAAFGVVLIGISAIVCSRTRVGLLVRVKKQFSYAKVVPGTETVDLEWDPTAET